MIISYCSRLLSFIMTPRELSFCRFTQWLSCLCFRESTTFLPQEFCNFTQWLSFSSFRESIRISFNIIILCNQSLCEAGVKEPISESIPSNIQKTMTLVQAYSILYPGCTFVKTRLVRPMILVLVSLFSI